MLFYKMLIFNLYGDILFVFNEHRILLCFGYFMARLLSDDNKSISLFVLVFAYWAVYGDIYID